MAQVVLTPPSSSQRCCPSWRTSNSRSSPPPAAATTTSPSNRRAMLCVLSRLCQKTSCRTMSGANASFSDRPSAVSPEKLSDGGGGDCGAQTADEALLDAIDDGGGDIPTSTSRTLVAKSPSSCLESLTNHSGCSGTHTASFGSVSEESSRIESFSLGDKSVDTCSHLASSDHSSGREVIRIGDSDEAEYTEVGCSEASKEREFDEGVLCGSSRGFNAPAASVDMSSSRLSHSSTDTASVGEDCDDSTVCDIATGFLDGCFTAQLPVVGASLQCDLNELDGPAVDLQALVVRQSSLQSWSARLLRRLRVLQSRSLRRQVVSRLESAAAPSVPTLGSADGNTSTSAPSTNELTIAGHHLRRLQAAVDSDVTESSSGSDSDHDQADDVKHQHQLRVSSSAGGVGSTRWLMRRWTRERARLAARWNWLLAQVGDLDFRMHQLNTLHSEMRSVRVFDSPNETADTCARARPLSGERYRKRRRMVHVNRHIPSPRGRVTECSPQRLPISVCTCTQCDPPSAHCVACIAGSTSALPSASAGSPLATAVGGHCNALSAGPVGSAGYRPDSCVHLLSQLSWRRQYLYQVRVRSSATSDNNPLLHARNTLDSQRRLSSRSDGTSSPLLPSAPSGGAGRQARQNKRRRVSSSCDDLFLPDSSSVGGYSTGRLSPVDLQPPQSVSKHHTATTRRSDSCDHSATDSGAVAARHWRQQRRNSFDIDNMVLPPGLTMVGRIERLKCKDIATPGWRCVTNMTHVKADINGGHIENGGDHSAEVLTEDVSDAAYERRHASHQLCERRRLCQQMPPAARNQQLQQLLASTADGGGQDQSCLEPAPVTSTQRCSYEVRRFPLSDDQYTHMLHLSKSDALAVKCDVKRLDVRHHSDTAAVGEDGQGGAL